MQTAWLSKQSHNLLSHALGAKTIWVFVQVRENLLLQLQAELFVSLEGQQMGMPHFWSPFCQCHCQAATQSS